MYSMQFNIGYIMPFEKMKETFKSLLESPMINERISNDECILCIWCNCYDSIVAGWFDPKQEIDFAYKRLNKLEAEYVEISKYQAANFTQKLYDKKMNELNTKLRKQLVYRKLDRLNQDFEV